MTTPKIVSPMIQKPCKHIISLQNLASTTSAFKVRISAYTPATKILASSVPTGWTQTASYPTSVVWRPAIGGVIPSGSPLPGTFSISVQNDAQQDKRVLLEWLSNHKPPEVLCRQILLVGCGKFADFVPEDWPQAMFDKDASFCRCLSAETEADEDSEQFAEPDLSVELGTPFAAGFLQVIVPYTILAEPPQLQFNRHWEVTEVDELGDEQPIVVYMSDNLNGQATFTLPDAGGYNFYLTVEDQANCVSDQYRDTEEYSDSDSASYTTNQTSTVIEKVNVDPCDPRKYQFTDATSPAGTDQIWSIKDQNGNLLVPPISGGIVQIYNFPNVNETYKVCLTATDPAGYSRPEVCVSVKPENTETQVDFEAKYISCPEHNFEVTFTNTSKSANCPVNWHWDFDDGTSSTVFEPVHTYINPGIYSVTLTMTIVGSSLLLPITNPVNIYHWVPDISMTSCNDGHVTFSTSPAKEYTWTFPGGSYKHKHRHRRTITVCYNDPGSYTVLLDGQNSDGGSCTEGAKVEIPDPINSLCPKEKVDPHVHFSYNGKDYRMITVFKYSGGKKPSRIFAKTKLQVMKKGHWRRKRARNIEVNIEGFVYMKDSQGCFTKDHHITAVAGAKQHANRAKVAKLLPFNYSSKVKQGSLTCKHRVKVDANHTFIEHDNSLWLIDCECHGFA